MAVSCVYNKTATSKYDAHVQEFITFILIMLIKKISKALYPQGIQVSFLSVCRALMQM